MRRDLVTGRRAAATCCLVAVLMVGCRGKPTVREGGICNLPSLLVSSKSQFDAMFGAPLSSAVAPSGRCEADYASGAAAYSATFLSAAPDSTLSSLLVDSRSGYADPDVLLRSMGVVPPPKMSEAPASVAYSPSALNLLELSVMRSNGVSGDWSKVYARLAPFADTASPNPSSAAFGVTESASRADEVQAAPSPSQPSSSRARFVIDD